MRDSLYERSLPELKAGIAKSSECIAHIHMHFELLYVRTGIIPVMIAGTVYTLHPGDCAVILPGIVHHHMDAEEGNSMFLAVCAAYFAGQYEETLKENFAQTPIIRKSDMSPTVTYLLDSLIELLKGRQKFTRQQSEITLSTFQLIFAYTLPLLSLRKRDQINLLDIAPYIMEYISKNITKKLTLEMLSKENHPCVYAKCSSGVHFINNTIFCTNSSLPVLDHSFCREISSANNIMQLLGR